MGERASDGGRRARITAKYRDRFPVLARALPWVTTGLAAVVVLFGLLLPNSLDRLSAGTLLRLPVEAIYLAALLLVLPRRAGRLVSLAAGVSLGLLTVLRLIDMGFFSVLDRPFDPVLDWILLDDAEEFLRTTVGRAGAVAVAAGIVILVLLVLVLMTLAVRRLSDLVVRNSVVATRTTLVLGTAWITISSLGLQAVEGIPFATKAASRLVEERAMLLRKGLNDGKAFAEQAAVDDFRGTSPDRLLTGLRGKDVIFAFVESYGRGAVEDPEMAPQVGAVLRNQDDRLREAGFSSRSGWLTSPTTGAGSWLAHSTLMSGLWIDNNQRYRTATASDRFTLTGAFQRSKAWRTVGMMPGVRRSWPEGQFYHFDKIYDSREMGYKGPMFSWSPVPDQYTMQAFERLENGRKNRKPLMTTVILATSHNPWAPLPTTVGWDEIGDGSIYHAQKKAGKTPQEVWKDPGRVRTEYRRSVQYSIRSLTDYVAKYGDKDTVLVFLGDHQPVPTVVGNDAGRDVPITIAARDPKVMDRMSDWGWDDGLKPGKGAPVWRMDSFRDRFLTTYGPRSR
ncbi:sulfatase [Streptomyces abyssalis]|uniref:sulfatase n=1 Tax=Streptomyces abyssalis TaxID=933944 RepID=UPI000B01E427|nr:sulfatase [Streptomyces abyssalis]